MSPDEIITQLTRVQRHRPVEALRAAGEQRAELTPRLLASLVEVVANPQVLEVDPDVQLPFYAMYLLAAWREPKAHPLLLGFLRLPGDQAVKLSGDIITQDMDRMLAQTCGSDPSRIVSLAIDPQVNNWSRVAAVSALSLLTAWGELPKATLLAHYRALIAATQPPSGAEEYADPLTEIVCSALDLQLVELRDEIFALYDRGWIDESVVGRDEVVDELGHAVPRPEKTPITDVADEIRWWGCFERAPRHEPHISTPLLAPPLAAIPAVDPIVPEERKPYRAPPKVGRNEPCPCGSGKKYKKCCGQ